MNPYQKNKLQWNCRRGLLELDLVLQRFLPHVEEEELGPLNEVLGLPDNDLWVIGIGRSDGYAPHLGEIVARLRAA